MPYRKLPIENVHVLCINSEKKNPQNDDRDTNLGWSLGWKTGKDGSTVKINIFCPHPHEHCVYDIVGFRYV